MLQPDLADGQLARFAFFPGGTAANKLGDHLRVLAHLAMDEEWRRPNDPAPFSLLHNYLLYQFKYLVDTQPEKLRMSASGNFAVFNTRLLAGFALGLEYIYALFERNRNQGHQPWCFKRWCVGWGEVVSVTTNQVSRERAFGPLPAEPLSTEVSSNAQPTWWKDFQPEVKHVWNALHILEENRERLRAICTEPGAAPPSDEAIAHKLKAALETSWRFAATNPRRVLPQLFLPGGLGAGHGWQRQLLVPLHLRAGRAADCALALELCRDPDYVAAADVGGGDGANGTSGWMYAASTVLELGMAYNNARAVNSVESPWLQTTIEQQRAAIVGLQAQLAAMQANADEGA